MAFADMFAPMRNFGATAAATTQANAALMGAEAAQSRAKTAERLAPWNMGATAVQGIGTLGGLAQKFMEMEQMRPQREAMTGYYEAMTREKNDPVARLQKATELGSQFYNTLLQRYWNNGLQPPKEVLDMMESGVMTAYGAKKAPAGPAPLSSFQAPPMAGGLSQLQISPQISAPGGLPARTTGGVMPVPQGGATALPPSPAPTPSQWLWPTDMDPEEANLNRKMAETITAGFNFGPSEEDLKTIGKIKKAERDAKLAGLRIDEKTRALLGDDNIAYLTSLKAAAAGFKQIGDIGIPVTPNSSVLRPLAEILMGRRALPQETTFDILTQITGDAKSAKAMIKNMNAKVAPRAGAGALLPTTEGGYIEATSMAEDGSLPPGHDATTYEPNVLAGIQPGSTPEQKELVAYDIVHGEEKPTPAMGGGVNPPKADERRQKFTDLVWDDEGNLKTTSQKMDIIREGFPDLLAELADGTIDSRTTGSRQKYLVTSMHRLAVGHLSPEKRKHLWELQLNKAAHAAGIPNNDVAAINKFRSRLQKKLKGLAYSFAPISKDISEEDIRTQATRGTVPDATHGDLYRQQGGGEFIATALSGVGSTVAGGFGANRKQLEAISQLILEPTGGKPINENQMAGLFQVGGVSGLLGGTDTFYRTTDLVAWQLDEEMFSHLDENEGGGLDLAQGVEEGAWQAVQVALAALTGGASVAIPWLGRAGQAAPGLARLAGLGGRAAGALGQAGGRVGAALGPTAARAGRIPKEVLFNLLKTPAGQAGHYKPTMKILGQGARLPPYLGGKAVEFGPGAAKVALGEEALRKLLGDLQKIPIPYVKEPWGASYGRIDNPLE